MSVVSPSVCCSSAPPGLWARDPPRQRLQPTGPAATPSDPPWPAANPPVPFSLPPPSCSGLSSSSERLRLILLISRDGFHSVWPRLSVWFVCFLSPVAVTGGAVRTQSVHTEPQTSCELACFWGEGGSHGCLQADDLTKGIKKPASFIFWRHCHWTCLMLSCCFLLEYFCSWTARTTTPLELTIEHWHVSISQDYFRKSIHLKYLQTLLQSSQMTHTFLCLFLCRILQYFSWFMPGFHIIMPF